MRAALRVDRAEQDKRTQARLGQLRELMARQAGGEDVAVRAPSVLDATRPGRADDVERDWPVRPLRAGVLA
jgi:hypothetical protein